MIALGLSAVLAVTGCAGATSHRASPAVSATADDPYDGVPTYLSPPPHPPQFGPFPKGARPRENHRFRCLGLPFPSMVMRVFNADNCWGLDYGLVGRTPYWFSFVAGTLPRHPRVGLILWNSVNGNVVSIRTRPGLGAPRIFAVQPPWLCVTYYGSSVRDSVDLQKNRLTPRLVRFCAVTPATTESPIG